METILYPHREYHATIDVDRARFNVPIRVKEITKLRIGDSFTYKDAVYTLEQRCLTVNNNAIQIDEISAIAKIRQESESKRQIEKRIHDTAVQQLQNKISWYESLDESGKADAFMKAMSPEGGEHMDFWSFFEYMKTRTDDIQNIE